MSAHARIQRAGGGLDPLPGKTCIATLTQNCSNSYFMNSTGGSLSKDSTLKNQIPFCILLNPQIKYVSVNLKSFNKNYFCYRIRYLQKYELLHCFPYEIANCLRCYLMQKCSKSSYYSFALKFEALSVMKLIHKCSKWKYSNYYLFSHNYIYCS